MIQLIPQDEVVTISHWKEITKAYKYEIRPTKKQEVESYRTCKDLYNILLGHRKDVYENGGWRITYEDQQKDLPKIRNISTINRTDNKVIMERSKFMPEEIGSISEKVKITIRRRKINKNNITPGTGERACLSSLNRDAMIQEAPAPRGGSSQPSFKKNGGLHSKRMAEKKIKKIVT